MKPKLVSAKPNHDKNLSGFRILSSPQMANGLLLELTEELLMCKYLRLSKESSELEKLSTLG